MIYTVTLNPSLDYILRLDRLQAGQVNRCREEAMLCGGKGINVSTVLHNFGVESVALGFVAGFTGAQILRELRRQGIRTEFFELDAGCSRVNVKIKAEQETELNGMGPPIPPRQMAQLLGRLAQLQPGDILVLAGSVPESLPEDTYERILAGLAERPVRVVVDATGPLLRRVLPFRPFLIKPNHHELGELFGRALRTDEEIAAAAHELQQEGACNVLVSMAGEGALLLGEDGQTYRSRPPQGRVVNSTGAGDSMVAGFLTGYLESGGDLQTALLTGLAAGSASAFSERLATRAEMEALLWDAYSL